jgi:DNA-binding PadR family transcriptional regulator
MEQKGWIKGAWGRTESNREAKFYSLTRAGERALAESAERWAGSQGWSTSSCSRTESL